ncbi:MAG: HD domain-containing protein [Chitinophagaceae bacterium]
MSKIINDPVHGFLSFPEKEVLTIVNHPWFQRLRNIMQMGVAHFVYPGAVHTRFLHSLGACHLMGKALEELQEKGFSITTQDSTDARLAILLHDIGHGPFSHALEHSLLEGIGHEQVSSVIIDRINQQHNGMLDGAMKIFGSRHPKRFLHQLVSSQLDVDRLDYLSRDSFYSGVSEGVIGYDRILKMLTIRNNELAVEEKGIYSVEKFIIARHIMYWQVYLHKTVLGAELLLVNILRRAKELSMRGVQLPATPALSYFLNNTISLEQLKEDPGVIDRFCRLDDSDIVTAIKTWMDAEDPVLARLCHMHRNRSLYKVVLDHEREDELYDQKLAVARREINCTEEELHYFVFRGTTSNSTYNAVDSRIMIAMKDGSLRNIAEMKDSLVNEHIAHKVTKRYLCFWQPKS